MEVNLGYPRTLPQHLLVFAKFWGHDSKTRLIPAVGKAGAVKISKELTERCVETVRSFALSDTRTLVNICCGGRSEDYEKLKQRFGSESKELYSRQVDGDLGAKLSAAFRSAFEQGARRVVVIGTDIPEIDVKILRDAFGALDHASIVIGPASDGGYYLIGMKTLIEDLFVDIPWSTSKVFDITMGIVKNKNLSFTTLPILRDVDLPEDIPYWETLSDHHSENQPQQDRESLLR